MRGSRFHPVSRRREVNRKTTRRSWVVVSKVLEIGKHWSYIHTARDTGWKIWLDNSLLRNSSIFWLCSQGADELILIFFVGAFTLCPCAERYYTNSKNLVPRRAQDRCFIFLLFLLGPIYVKQERSYSALQSRLLKDYIEKWVFTR